MPFIFVIIDDVNLPKHRMHYVIIPKLILHTTDVALVLLTHVNNHIAPKDD